MPSSVFFRVQHTRADTLCRAPADGRQKSLRATKKPRYGLVFFGLILTRNDKLGVFYHKCVHFMDFVLILVSGNRSHFLCHFRQN